jgi:hypothetical protein
MLSSASNGALQHWLAAFKYFSLIRGIVQRNNFKIIVPFTYFSMHPQGQNKISEVES